MRIITVAFGIVVIAAALGGCARRGGAGTTITQVGSTTLLPLAQKWREAFNAERPGIDIAVSGGGSGTGIRALIDGSANIANSSREMKETEIQLAMDASVGTFEHVVAHDGIALIVHPSNPLTTISVEQASDIYSGAVTDWGAVGAPGLGRIQIVSRDSASGTYEAFKELVVTQMATEKRREYAAAALKQTSNQAVLALVARTKTAIGYVSLGYLDDSVKWLSIVPLGGEEPVAPTVDNVLSGEYPVSRPLFCYTNGEPVGAVAEYMEWVMGPGGQAVVEELGFVPVSE